MQNSVESRVKNIIVKQLGVKAEDLSLDKTIIDDLGADSLDAVEVVMALEEEFGLEIPEERASSLRTVGDAISYINDNASAQA